MVVKTLEQGRNRLSFRSKTGIRPTPLEIYSIPILSSFSSPNTPSPCSNSVSDNNQHSHSGPTTLTSPPILINGTVCNKCMAIDDDCYYQSVHFSELWAGPTYSCSPPPSSLPMPKFSFQRKRTVSVSLELPNSSDEVEMHPRTMSAPPSPTRDQGHNLNTGEFFHSAETKTLCRILNLDIDYE